MQKQRTNSYESIPPHSYGRALRINLIPSRCSANFMRERCSQLKNMIRILQIISLTILISSCNQSSKNLKNADIKDLHGVYHYIEDSGAFALRNWGKKYWELSISKEESKLSYFETGRGLNSFDLAIAIENNNNSVKVRLDSIISTAYLPPNELELVKTGDLLLTLKKTENGFETNSDFMFVTQPDTVNISKIRFNKIENKLATTKPKLH